jgi:serine/threonine-protein kinase HipA
MVDIYQDKPALMMHGKKVWFNKESLVIFGIKHCLLTQKEADTSYEECIVAIKQSIIDIENYMLENQEFKTIGTRMIESFKISLNNQTIKELPLELTRTW